MKKTLLLIGMAILLGSITPAAYALDADYSNIGPVTQYDPGTDTITPFFGYGWYMFGTQFIGGLNPNDYGFDYMDTNTNLLRVQVGNNVANLYITSAIAGIAGKIPQAEAAGIKIEISFSEHLWDNIGDDNITGMIDAVNLLKTEPAIQGWRLGDELPISNHITAKAAATLIRTADPNHQISQVQHPLMTEAEVV